MIAESDKVCEDLDKWKELANEIPSYKSTTVIEGWGHSFFMKPSGESGDKFMEEFLKILEEHPAKPRHVPHDEL